MEKQSETTTLKSICRDIQLRNEETEDHLHKLSVVFGSRFVKAQDALTKGRVKKYVFLPSGRVVWIVVGKQREYLVMPAADFCSCEDFYFRFDRGHLCYHIIAQRLAEVTGQFAFFEDDDSFYEILIREWKTFKTKVSEKQEQKNTT